MNTQVNVTIKTEKDNLQNLIKYAEKHNLITVKKLAEKRLSLLNCLK